MLSAHFIAHLGSDVDAGDPEQLERALASCIATARAAHPAIALDEAAFVAHVARAFEAGEHVLDELPRVHADSLHLALACARGDATALATIERLHGPAIAAALARERLAADGVDEILQRTRAHLYTARTDRPPRIAEYKGRGDLGRWLKATAVRLAIDDHRATGREVAIGDDALADLVLANTDPGLAHAKAASAVHVRAALREALLALDATTRREVRLYYLDGLGLEQIAGLEGVAASTIQRRLVRAREAILAASRRALREHLGIANVEVDSLIDFVGSRLELPRSALDDDT